MILRLRRAVAGRILVFSDTTALFAPGCPYAVV
jgi:hypothetical protein